MATKPAKSLSIKRHSDVLRSHRRPKVSLSRVLAYLINGIGDRVYYLGATVERSCKNGWRTVRRGIKFVFAGLFHALKIVFGYIGRIIAGVWDDISTPFRKMRRSFKSLSIVIKSTEDRGTKFTLGRVQLFFKYGWLWNKHLVARFINYLAPLVSLVVCLIVVSSMVHLNYAIEISYNGQTVGYVENEEVYDSARKIIQSKMVSNDQAFWKEDTTMRIAVVNSTDISTQDIMAENILNASGEIMPACGVYIGGMFYGASAAPDLVQQALEALKAPQLAAAEEIEEDVNVKFARDVEYIEGIYPSGSVMPYEKLVAMVTSQEPVDIYYNAVAGENVMEIAVKNGISRDQMQALNASVNLDQALVEDTKLLVATNEPLLRVKTVRVETVVEDIPFEIKIQNDASLPISIMIPVSEGKNGEQVITYEYEYLGDKIEKTELSREVIREPVNGVTIVGTKGAGNGSGHGTGTFIWPTANGYRVTRGWSSYHFGIDIAAPAGTSIYAADDGVVIEAKQIAWDYGIYVIVDHQNGYQTMYAHNSANLVQVGDIVSKGQVIALMGSTGNSTGNHLHFEVRIQGNRVDPAPYIGWGGSLAAVD